jgi:hypothetical protein
VHRVAAPINVDESQPLPPFFPSNVTAAFAVDLPQAILPLWPHGVHSFQATIAATPSPR